MKARNVTESDLKNALRVVNRKYAGNVAFKTLGPTGPRKVSYDFTLRVNDSSAPGHRLGFTRNKDGARRRLAAACWHVHGDFFDALLKVEQRAVILSGRKLTIDINGGNWIDRQIGSPADPLYCSEACDC